MTQSATITKQWKEVASGANGTICMEHTEAAWWQFFRNGQKVGEALGYGEFKVQWNKHMKRSACHS